MIRNKSIDRHCTIHAIASHCKDSESKSHIYPKVFQFVMPSLPIRRISIAALLIFGKRSGSIHAMFHLEMVPFRM